MYYVITKRNAYRLSPTLRPKPASLPFWAVAGLSTVYYTRLLDNCWDSARGLVHMAVPTTFYVPLGYLMDMEWLEVIHEIYISLLLCCVVKGSLGP